MVWIRDKLLVRYGFRTGSQTIPEPIWVQYLLQDRFRLGTNSQYLVSQFDMVSWSVPVPALLQDQFQERELSSGSVLEHACTHACNVIYDVYGGSLPKTKHQLQSSQQYPSRRWMRFYAYKSLETFPLCVCVCVCMCVCLTSWKIVEHVNSEELFSFIHLIGHRHNRFGMYWIQNKFHIHSQEKRLPFDRAMWFHYII